MTCIRGCKVESGDDAIWVHSVGPSGPESADMSERPDRWSTQWDEFQRALDTAGVVSVKQSRNLQNPQGHYGLDIYLGDGRVIEYYPGDQYEPWAVWRFEQ